VERQATRSADAPTAPEGLTPGLLRDSGGSGVPTGVALHSGSGLRQFGSRTTPTAAGETAPTRDSAPGADHLRVQVKAGGVDVEKRYRFRSCLVCRLLRRHPTRVAMGGFLGKLNPAIAGAAPEIRRPCCRLARSGGPRPGDDRGRISVTLVGAFVL